MTAGQRTWSPAVLPTGDTISISMLGPFAFRRGNNAAVRLPKKAQALLAYLAMAQGRAFPRDQLATLLWGDSGTEQARQSLRQSLVVLRSAIGPRADQILIADTAAVLLAQSDRITLDVDRFTSLAASDRPDDIASACTLYRDEFLAGLHIPADGFSRWVADERERLSSLRSDAVLRLAEAQASAGKMDEALASARQLTALDPLREDGHRLLMRVLADAGHRNAALQHYARCAELLRAELGVAPEGATIALAEALRADRPLRQTDNNASGHARGSTHETADNPRLPDSPSIAILPFVNLSGDASRDYLVRGLVEDITVALGRERWLFVIASPSAFAFSDGTELREVGAKLGVRYVLRGSVRIEANQALFVAQLNDVAHGRSVWSGRFQDEIDNVFALQERLTTRVAAAIAPALKSAEVQRAQHKPTKDLTAFDLYLQALPRFRASPQENRQALKLLYRAIELDPSYGTAYGLAARCFQFQKMFDWLPPRDPALQEGVRLGHLAADTGRDDSEALWMAALALTHLSGEIEHSLALIERSLSLNPNSADAWTASCLVRSYLGDSATAVEHFNRAQRLNPLDQSQHLHWNIVAWAYIAAARYKDAAAAADRTLHVQPNYLPGLRLKVGTCGLLGRLDEGRLYLGRLLAAQPSCTVSWMRDFLEAPLRSNPQVLESYLEGFRRVGMPEGPRTPGIYA